MGSAGAFGNTPFITGSAGISRERRGVRMGREQGSLVCRKKGGRKEREETRRLLEDVCRRAWHAAEFANVGSSACFCVLFWCAPP